MSAYGFTRRDVACRDPVLVLVSLPQTSFWRSHLQSGSCMLKRFVVAFGILVVPMSSIVLDSAGPAFATPPPAVGSASCSSVLGSGTVHPGLTTAGSIGGVKITFKGKLGGCTSSITAPSGTTVVGGKISGSGYYDAPTTTSNGSSCANFDGPDVVGVIKIKITWTVVGPAIAKTKITYTAVPATVTGPTNGTDTIDLYGPPFGALTGSFFPFATPLVGLTTNLPAPGTRCSTTPFVNFKIVGGAVGV